MRPLKFLCGLLCCYLPTAAATLDYAAWAGTNPDGGWTQAAESAVANSVLPRQVPADVANFCPNYPKLASHERRKFWVGLLSAMSKPESNFRPHSRYQEKFTDRQGRPVISRGLLQISQESANQRRYNCDIRHPQLLHDPVINLACGVRILALWVSQDGVIASPAYQVKGGGRYWSTLRSSNGKVEAIADFTRQLPFCSNRHFATSTPSPKTKPPRRRPGIKLQG